jgi:hypothetical protein
MRVMDNSSSGQTHRLICKASFLFFASFIQKVIFSLKKASKSKKILSLTEQVV